MNITKENESNIKIINNNNNTSILNLQDNDKGKEFYFFI